MDMSGLVSGAGGFIASAFVVAGYTMRTMIPLRIFGILTNVVLIVFSVMHHHYPVMVLLHSAFLVGCLVEVPLADRPFLPWLGWPMLALLVAAHVLRWWCIRTLGNQWNTRVVIVPGLPLVTGGPYRWIRHPNYVAVVLEGVALPLVHTAWLTALAFTVLNAALLFVRIRVEDAALATAR